MTTKEKTTDKATAPDNGRGVDWKRELAACEPRIPWHPVVEEKFGIDKNSWKALVDAIFPSATTFESVVLALSYCKARRLDPFKRNVHIVPIYNKMLERMVDTIWPGIGELRTTAFRTGEYAGRARTEFGPDVTQKVGSKDVTFPSWAQVTVYRIVKGDKVEFCGPQVYWIETYATFSRSDATPNSMWGDRPRGQIDKCAEAAALRGAFPEEVGGEYIPEEVQHDGGQPQRLSKAVARSLEDLTGQREVYVPQPEERETVPKDDPYTEAARQRAERLAAESGDDRQPGEDGWGDK